MNGIAFAISRFASEGSGWPFKPMAQSVGDFFFFRTILSYLRDKIQGFGIELMGNVMEWVGAGALTLMTLWLLIQGYRIVTGQTRDSMMALVTNSARAALIVAVATSMAFFGRDMHEFLSNDLKAEIAHVVTGSNKSPEDQIDDSLAWMQVALSSIDVLDVVDDPTLDDQKTRAMWFTGVGTGGPAITGGAMLLLYEVAMALFIGLGPLFILCLLFEQTKQFFHKWLWYGVGTMFSMAVLAAMVSIAMDMVVRVAGSIWGASLAGNLLRQNFSDGMTSQAMQQGGLGLILTTLIISTPPMAAAFFQGTMGSFMHFSAFGGGAASRPGPQGQPVGSYAVSQVQAGAQRTHPEFRGNGVDTHGANAGLRGTIVSSPATTGDVVKKRD